MFFSRGVAADLTRLKYQMSFDSRKKLVSDTFFGIKLARPSTDPVQEKKNSR